MDKVRKLAVIGGGGGSISTVFSLTSDPDWKKKFDITVYQIGWRLGGKAATGRNPELFDRIEEHGVHMMWGCYDNTFRILREAYAEYGRDPKLPFSSVVGEPNSVLYPYDQYILGHFNGNKFEPFYSNYKPNDMQPGTKQPGKTVEDWLVDIISFIVGSVAKKSDTAEGADTSKHGLDLNPLSPDNIRKAIRNRTDTKSHISILDILEKIVVFLVGLVNPGLADTIKVFYWVTKVIIANFDLLMKEGWQALDDWDLLDLMVHYGGQDALDSPTIAFVYSGIFTNGQKMAAGTSLYITIKGLVGYKGSIMYKFKAGMAEAVFTPLYEVLKKRGVKFKFFHRVANLGLSADGKSIDRINVVQQATLKNADYQPLYDVKQVPCWPSHPWYDQLKEGDALKAYNLESYDPTPFDRPITLERGKDFDHVLLGASIASLPYICAELYANEKKPAFRTMCDMVRTTQTFDIQMSFMKTTAEMGYVDKSGKNLPPNINEYHPPWTATPINNWQDFSEMLQWESWEKLPPEQRPKGRGFIEGTIMDYSPKYYRDIIHHFLLNCVSPMWPKVTAPNPMSAIEGTGVDWSIIWTGAKPGEKLSELEIINRQWIPHVNNPSDRYVQAVAGTTKFRLAVDESGYDNLTFAGDWVRTPMSVGCFESTIMSGIQASNVLLGKPRDEGISF